LVQRISTLTTATAAMDDTMSGRLSTVAANPFMDWRFSDKSKELTPSKNTSNTPQKKNTPSPNRFGIDSLPPSLRSVESPSPVPDPSSPVGNATPSGTKRSASAEPKSDEIEESVNKRLKMAKELVSLESYYYCNLAGEENVLSNEFKADMAFKCHVCKKLFMNNLEFMKHLHLHVETDRETAIDMADLTQCKYCYKDFDSEQKAQAHTDQDHCKKDSPYVCLICNSGFPQSTHLIHHMTKVHVKAEMPYQCQICGHRSSQYREIIEHFQETHDRTDKLQCPQCLKSYSLYGDKGYNSNNAVSFMQHLQRHEDMKSKNQLNCKKCCLKFLDDKSMKTHVTDDHVSFKDFDTIEIYQYVASDTPVQMPRPDEKQLKVAVKKSQSVKPLPQQAAFAAQNLEDMAIYGTSHVDRCCECDRSMILTGHYVAYLCCTKCRYSSCCAKAMSVHVQLFHSGSKPQFDLGRSVIMKEPMFCVCGYSAHSGNKLAKHLGSNSCKSAYPNLEEAVKARVGQDVTSQSPGSKELIRPADSEIEKEVDHRISITEAHKSSEKAALKDVASLSTAAEAVTETAGPLAFLGLQRKGSKDDDKIEKSDEEGKDKCDEEGREVFDEDSQSKGEGNANSVISTAESSEKLTTKSSADDMDVDADVSILNDEDDENAANKQPGTVLFGTMFKYMGEKKEGEGSIETQAEQTTAKQTREESTVENTGDIEPPADISDKAVDEIDAASQAEKNGKDNSTEEESNKEVLNEDKSVPLPPSSDEITAAPDSMETD